MAAAAARDNERVGRMTILASKRRRGETIMDRSGREDQARRVLDSAKRIAERIAAKWYVV